MDAHRSQRYICWTREQMRYLLGDAGYSYVVGFWAGTSKQPKYPQRPADAAASCPSLPENCTAVNSLYNPAPNPHILEGALVQVRIESKFL